MCNHNILLIESRVHKVWVEKSLAKETTKYGKFLAYPDYTKTSTGKAIHPGIHMGRAQVRLSHV
jgi:hypothetical protein